MRILHSLFTNAVGGTERHVADLANAQAADGHKVMILIRGNRCSKLQQDGFLNWLEPQVTVKRLPNCWVFLKWPLLPIMKVLREFKPDIIHTHHGRDSRYLARAAGKIPIIASLHMRYRKKDYKRHDGLICVSNWQLATLPPAIKPNSVLIPNWVKPPLEDSHQHRHALREKLGISDDVMLFGYVGRLTSEKAPDDLLQAFSLANIANSHLVFLGEGELRKTLEASLPTDNSSVSFMGYTKDIFPWYHAIDCFMLPSREESFGLVLLEAMQAGCPIVTTKTDGAKDLLQQNSDVIFAEISSPIALSHALKRAAASLPIRYHYPELEMHRLDQANEAIVKFYQRFL